MNPQYEIWVAYNSQPLTSVFMEDCETYEQACQACCEYQTHDRAAWIVDKETREIVTLSH